MATDRRTLLRGLASLTALQGAGAALRSRPAAAAPADAPITIDPNPGYARIACEEDHVLYAMDYPYQMDDYEVAATDTLPIPYEHKKKLFQTNAERVFNL